MPVSKDKERELQEKMKKIGIKEEDILEKFIIGSGRGGQNLQKTASCVYLKHLPTGIVVKCQKERSRQVNRFLARRRLVERFEEDVLKVKTKKQDQIEKIRKAKKRRQRRQKQIIKNRQT